MKKEDTEKWNIQNDKYKTEESFYVRVTQKEGLTKHESKMEFNTLEKALSAYQGMLNANGIEIITRYEKGGQHSLSMVFINHEDVIKQINKKC